MILQRGFIPVPFSTLVELPVPSPWCRVGVCRCVPPCSCGSVCATLSQLPSCLLRAAPCRAAAPRTEGRCRVETSHRGLPGAGSRRKAGLCWPASPRTRAEPDLLLLIANELLTPHGQPREALPGSALPVLTHGVRAEGAEQPWVPSGGATGSLLPRVPPSGTLGWVQVTGTAPVPHSPAPRTPGIFPISTQATRAEPARCGRRRRWSPYGTELNTTAARRSLQVLKVNGAARACGDEGRAQRGALGLRGVRDVNGSTGKRSREGLGLATGPLGISEISE